MVYCVENGTIGLFFGWLKLHWNPGKVVFRRYEISPVDMLNSGYFREHDFNDMVTHCLKGHFGLLTIKTYVKYINFILGC